MIRVKDKKIPWQEGMTVADLIRTVGDPYPYAVVSINGETVSLPNFERTPVPDNAEVILIPMIAGG
ncbi:MAG: sulfur carrier protein ThiS [Desulfatiglandales bacterium]